METGRLIRIFFQSYLWEVMVETKKVAEEVEEIVVFWVYFEYRAKKIGSRVEKREGLTYWKNEDAKTER